MSLATTAPTFARFRAFGAAAQAFFEQRVKAQEKLRREGQIRPSRQLAAKAGMFGASFGAKLQNRRVALSTRGAIEVDPRLGEAIQDLIAAGSPAMAAAVDTHLGALAEHVFAAWPVRTGLSKSMLDLEVVPLSTTRVRYTFASRYDRTMQAPRLRTALNQLVRPRVQPTLAAIGADMLADLSRGG